MIMAVITAVLGIYYVAKYSEWDSECIYINGNPDDWDEELAYWNGWVTSGVGLSTVSGMFAGFCDVTHAFHDLLVEIFSNSLISEFEEVDPDTGLKHIPDLTLHFPNNLVLKIIDGGQVADFIVSIEDIEWYGHVWAFPGENSKAIPGYKYFVAMRLTADPNFEFRIPYTNQLNYVDPATGLIKPGSQCVPEQWLHDTDADYLLSWLYWSGLIIDILYHLGLFNTLQNWFHNYLMKRQIRKVRDRVSIVDDKVNQVKMSAEEIHNFVESLHLEVMTPLSVDTVSKFNDIYEKMKHLGYRPYG